MSRQSVIGVYGQNYQQVFSLAKTINISVKETAMVMEHPVETGSMVADHRIIQLIGIDMSIIVESGNIENIYKEIKQNFTNGALLLVQTRVATYVNQIIEALPHEEDATMFDAISIALSLKEFRFVTTQTAVLNVTPSNPANTSTVDRGTQLPQSPRIPASALAGWLK